MKESNASIQCGIVAANSKQRKELKQIARTCAIDLKLQLPLKIRERSQPASDGDNGTTVTFSIPVGIALAYDSIWKLACRMAYFCPHTRVTTQITTNC